LYTLRAALLPKQVEYVNSTKLVQIYNGGVGAGKTIANVIKAIKLAIEFPGIEILVAAPTYAMLKDTVMREFESRCPAFLIQDFFKGNYPEVIFHANAGRHSTIRFRSFDDPGKPKGITVGAAIIDEVTEMPEGVLAEIEKRLRQEGMPNVLCMTTNPDSKEHYIYKRFIAPALDGSDPSVHYINTESFDNFTLPASYLAQLARLEKLRPGEYMRSVKGLWGDFNENAIGAFLECDGFSSQYRVAFIDGSFSDKQKSDRTSVAIVCYVPQPGIDKLYWPIEFTGQTWEKSITDKPTILEMLRFLDVHAPVETCLESQLGDSTKIFLDNFRQAENELGLTTKNYWTFLHQTEKKHEKIMVNIAGNKDRLRVIKGTSPAFLNPIVNYVKGVPHDDEADALAGAVNQWRTSKVLSEFINLAERKGRARR